MIFQFRFPAGLVRREQFTADAKLADVLMFVSENCPIQLQDIELVQVRYSLCWFFLDFKLELSSVTDDPKTKRNTLFIYYHFF